MTIFAISKEGLYSPVESKEKNLFEVAANC
jgi:hypothetical protein